MRKDIIWMFALGFLVSIIGFFFFNLSRASSFVVYIYSVAHPLGVTLQVLKYIQITTITIGITIIVSTILLLYLDKTGYDIKKLTSFVNRKYFPIISLILIVLFGAIIRFITISQHNISADSYRFMFIAKNIFEYGSVVGRLGNDGILWFPQNTLIVPIFHFPLYKWGYGLFMVPFFPFLKDWELAGHALSYLAGVVSIPLMYLYTKEYFKSVHAGLIAALMISISITHVGLSGYVMADTLNLFFIICALLTFILAIKNDKKQMYLASGTLVGFAIITRPESVLIILPLLYLYLTRSPRRLGNVFSFLLGISVITLAVWLWISHDLSVYGNVISTQIGRSMEISPAGRSASNYFSTYLSTYNLKSGIYSIILFGLGNLSILFFGLVSLVYFAKTDRHVTIFSIIYILLFFIFYSSYISPYIRYYLVLLPAFIAPGSYVFYKLVSQPEETIQKIIPKIKNKNFSSTFKFLIIFLAISIIIGSSFFQTIYLVHSGHGQLSTEKEQALKLNALMEEGVIPQDALLVGCLGSPMACYYYTGLSVAKFNIDTSLLNYTYLKQLSKNKPLLIIVDYRFRMEDPKLAEAVERQYADKLVANITITTSEPAKIYCIDFSNEGDKNG